MWTEQDVLEIELIGERNWMWKVCGLENPRFWGVSNRMDGWWYRLLKWGMESRSSFVFGSEENESLDLLDSSRASV